VSVKYGLHSEGEKTEAQRRNFCFKNVILLVLVCIIAPAWHGCFRKLFFSVRAKEHFEATLLEPDRDMILHPSEKQVLQCYCNLIDQIGSSSHTLGKDGKFQLFMCLCARWVLLPPLPLLLL
jgi:hypothetical protein